MYSSWLNASFVATRTTTIKDPVTHIAKTVTTTTSPTACRIGRSTGNVIQTSPQAVYSQSLRLYTLIDADIKAGDIITVNNVKYTVGNPYLCNLHHIEADITLKQEV
jgi:hypothetical protein